MTAGGRTRSQGPTARRALATAWLILILVLVVLSLGLSVAVIQSGHGVAVSGLAFASLTLGASFAVVGWLVATRESANPLGWVYLGIGLSQAGLAFVDDAAYFGLVSSPGSIPFADVLSWVSAWIWAPGFTLLISFSVLLFPDGHLLSPRWRPVAWLAVASMLLVGGANAVASWPLRGVALLGQWGDPPGILGPIFLIGILTIPIVALASVGSIVVRFRRSTGQERLQLKWFTFAAIVEIAFVVASGFNLLDPTFITVFVGLLIAPLLPIAIGVAILRYRLYEIDRVVSRTVGYLIVTGVLAVVFVGAVFVFTAISAPMFGDNPVAVAASTLIVAALFQPLRRRVQQAVDRRFDRARYHGERTVAAFSDRLRDEVDMTTITGDLTTTTSTVLAPTSIGLWLRESEGRA